VVSGTASVTTGTGAVSGDPVFSGTTMTVELTGVADVQRIAVSLGGITDNAGQILPPTVVDANILIGDANGSKIVNSTDISQVKSESGAPITQANFRRDVTPTGSVTASDVSLAKARAGFSVP
jgi:hypothetical protein